MGGEHWDEPRYQQQAVFIASGSFTVGNIGRQMILFHIPDRKEALSTSGATSRLTGSSVPFNPDARC